MCLPGRRRVHLSSVLESVPDVTNSEEAVLVLLGSVSEVLNSGVDAAQVHEGINDSGNSGGFPVESTVESGPSRWQTARGPGDGGGPREDAGERKASWQQTPPPRKELTEEINSDVCSLQTSIREHSAASYHRLHARCSNHLQSLQM